MPQLPAPGRPVLAGPRFYVTPPQRFSLASILLAFIAASIGVPVLVFAFTHSRHAVSSTFGAGGPGHGGDGFDAGGGDDRDDDPSRVDTIYLGGPDEAPVATRPGGAPRTVHPFVVINLPRSGDQVGQIPDTPAGHLLFAWLAAFNSTSPSTFAKALPTAEAGTTEAAQMELRKQTGGFTLLAAKEVAPGILVFRLHDQTPAATEVLGTLQVRPDTSPATIASFSLRAVPTPQAKAP